jgi:excisionase family DNA binding protein
MTVGSNADNKLRAFFTPEDLAKYLAISIATVYRLVSKRQLPFHKIGGVLGFKREDIERYLDDGRIEPSK